MRGARRQSGVSLIEAIVALVLVASVGMALFAWINTSLQTLNRIADIDARSRATTNVLEYMAGVNPMEQEEGSADLGAYRIKWQAKAIEGARDGANYPRGMSLYRLARYDTAISVLTADNRPWFDLTLRQVGYRKVRDLRPIF